MDNAQAAAYYYARKKRRLLNQPLSLIVQPRAFSIAHQTLAADTFVAGVRAVDNEVGVTTLSLTGTDAAQFKLVGNNLELKSGDVLVAGTLNVTVHASNTVKGTSDYPYQVTVT